MPIYDNANQMLTAAQDHVQKTGHLLIINDEPKNRLIGYRCVDYRCAEQSVSEFRLSLGALKLMSKEDPNKDLLRTSEGRLLIERSLNSQTLTIGPILQEETYIRSTSEANPNTYNKNPLVYNNINQMFTDVQDHVRCTGHQLLTCDDIKKLLFGYICAECEKLFQAPIQACRLMSHNDSNKVRLRTCEGRLLIVKELNAQSLTIGPILQEETYISSNM